MKFYSADVVALDGQVYAYVHIMADSEDDARKQLALSDIRDYINLKEIA